MPDNMTGGMTVLSRQSFEAATVINLSATDAAAALAAVPARSFAEILERFTPQEDLRRKLTDGLCGDDPSRSRESMDKKVRGWLSGKYRPTAREDLWELCFILSLSVENADGFLAMTSEEGIHWRDPKELTYAFALRSGKTWPEARELLKRVLPEGETFGTDSARESFTSVVRREAAGQKTEEELKQYLADAREKLGVYHNRAYQQFAAYLSLLESPQTAGAVEEEESYTIRRIVETYLDNKFPAGWDKKKLDEKRQGILAGWPDEVTLSRMKTGKTDVNRKTLILLFLATDGGEELSEDWEEDAEDEEDDADADFRSSYMRMNQMLLSCGYSMLDSRNPFDWVVLYCMRVGSDPDAMAGLSERLSEMLETVFPSDVPETE